MGPTPALCSVYFILPLQKQLRLCTQIATQEGIYPSAIHQPTRLQKEGRQESVYRQTQWNENTSATQNAAFETAAGQNKVFKPNTYKSIGICPKKILFFIFDF